MSNVTGGERTPDDPDKATQILLGLLGLNAGGSQKGHDTLGILDRNVANMTSQGNFSSYSLNGDMRTTTDIADSAEVTDRPTTADIALVAADINAAAATPTCTPSVAARINSDADEGNNDVFEAEKNQDDDDQDQHQKPFYEDENINLTGSNESHSFPVYGNCVTIRCSSSKHTSASSKVKIDDTIANFVWESRYYFGQLVVVNPTCDFIAYAVLTREKNGAVRVANLKTKKRDLLHGMKGVIVDLAFSHYSSEILLASIDEFGTLFVHSIKELDSKLDGHSVLTVRRADTAPSFYRRVVWCHYIPENITPDEDEDDANDYITEYDLSRRLAVINNNTAEILNVEAVIKEHGSEPINISDLSTGYRLIAAHTMPISSATFSPDGTALATISIDGRVKFFQIYIPDTRESWYLHNWNPHNGKPLSALFFLDDHSSTNPECQFWKFAITGADMNRELKVWNCASWTCLQTIRFEVPEGDSPKPEMKAGIDITASYLLLSDVRRNVLYILNIYQDVNKNIPRISCVSEFSLTSPMLSYAILSASRKELQPTVEEEQLEENLFGDVLADDERKYSKEETEEVVVLKLIYVQPKSLQKCVITYKPALSMPDQVNSASSFSLESISFKDHLTDLNYDTCSSEASGAIDRAAIESTLKLLSNKVHDLSGQLLFPPESFTSEVPGVNDGTTTTSTNNHNVGSSHDDTMDSEHDLMIHRDSTPIKCSRQHVNHQTPTPRPMHDNGSASSERSRTSSENKEDGDDEDDETIVVSYDHVRHGIGMTVPSNGSSPSLEVQEILNKDLNKDMGFIDQNSQKHLPDNDDLTSAATRDLNDLLGLSAREGSNRVSAKAKSLSPLPTFSDGESGIVGNTNHLVKWPTAPKMPDYEQRKRRLIRTSSPKSATINHAWTKNIPSAPSDLNSDRYEYLTRSIWALTQTIENQKCELQYLRQTVGELKVEIGEAALARSVANELLKNNITATLNAQLQKRRKEDNTIISNLLRSHDERLVSQLMQTVNTSVITRLDGAVQTEFRKSILPNVMHELQGLKTMMHHELAQKMGSTDNLLRENIARIVESKSVATSIAHAVAGSIKDSTRAAFNDVLQNAVVPSFEKSCQAMFHQISDAFHKGAKEYSHHMEKCLDKQQKEGAAMMNTQILGVIDTIQARIENEATIVGERIDKKLSETLAKFEDGLSQRFSALMQKEMNSAIKEHQVAISSTVANVIRSRAVTPVQHSPMDRSMQQILIVQLLQHGDLNGAFQQALSANDLSLVMFVCEKVNPGRLFSGESPCPLQQPVVLSLIHQLAVDLNTRTELKHDFLQEALLIVDVDDQVTSNHVPIVMETLQANLRQYIRNNPGAKMSRNMRLLLMATESVLHSRGAVATTPHKQSTVADMFASFSQGPDTPIYE